MVGCTSIAASTPYIPVSENEEFMINSIEKAKQINVTVIANGTGAGVLIDSDDEGYYVLTAAHVAFNSGAIYHSELKKRYDFVLISEDIVYDLALLYIETQDELKTYDLEVYTTPTIGQEIFALGSPMGKFNYVVSGIITHTDTGYRLLNNVAFMHDAFVSEGFSGGGLYNMRGELLGINVATINDNMALTLNLNAIRSIIEQMRG
jgi:S1-C subfamily serine protease